MRRTQPGWGELDWMMWEYHTISQMRWWSPHLDLEFRNDKL